MLNANKTAMVGIILTFISVVIALFAWLIPVNGNNSGIDPETHAKVLAEKILMERQLAEAKQAKITSLNDNDEIKKLLEQGNYQQAEKLALKNRIGETAEDDLLLLRLSYLQEQYQQAIHRGEALLSSDYQRDAEFYSWHFLFMACTI